MRRRLRALPAVWLLLLLAAPAAAWLLGARQPLVQNTPKAAFPHLDRSSLRDQETFDRLDAALLDRLPLRGTALEVRARVALDVFHDSTNPDIAVGDGRWLYYVPELAPCRPGGAAISDPADAVELLARTLVAGGYRPIVVTAGSKLLIHTRDAPTLDDAELRCARALEDRVNARLKATPGGLVIDDRLRMLEAHGHATFLHWDSHWNWRGRELFVRAVLDRIRPGLARETGLHAGRGYSRAGDLAALLGLDRSEPDRVVEASRAPKRPLAPGSVLLIGDSQVDHALLFPADDRGTAIHDRVLPGQPTCTWSAVLGGGCDEPLRTARTVLIEKVARDAQFTTTNCWRPLAVAAERIPAGAPGRWVVSGESSESPTRTLTIPASGSIDVHVRASGGDVSANARLLRLPIARATGAVSLTQLPASGQTVPCATPAPLAPTGSLYVPLPAGRQLSDLVLRIAGTAGTRFGAPQETVLDGA